MSINNIRLFQTIFFHNLHHFVHLLFLLSRMGLLELMIFNDVDQVVKALINGSTLLTVRAIDRVIPSGSLEGLTNTLDNEGVR